MALLVQLNYYDFKFFFTVPCLALYIYPTAFSVRGVLYFLLMPAIRALYFLFLFNYCSPAILLSISFMESRKFSTSASLRSSATRLCQSLLIFRISGVKCSNTFSSSSVLMRTILPNGVSGSKPAKRSVNSSHDMSLASRLSRMPYWLLKLDTINPKSSIMS